MKLVHLADMHLGFRAYQRQTQFGLNQRESDVAMAFRRAIDKIIELRPNVIVIGGDVFHAVRPTNPAILHAYAQFSRLREILPDTEIVMVAGNHDTPRTSETGYIIRLFRSLGINVIDTEPLRLRLLGGELSVLGVPYHMRPVPSLDPDSGARYNVLLMHDQIEGIASQFGPIEQPGGNVDPKDLNAERWDYVALGHYHVYHQVAPNAFYSGSLEYSSTNIWGEKAEEGEKRPEDRGKGIIERDLDTGTHRFHRIASSRAVVDLPAINASAVSAAELSEAICAAVDDCEDGIDDKIVRLVVREVPRHVLRELDHRKIREFKKRALHFLLDCRRPEPVRPQSSFGRRASLAETVRLMLESRPVTPGIDRTALVDLGMRYLNEADRLAPALTGDEL